MPYKSQAQAGFFHEHKKQLEAEGVNVAEWDAATAGKHLPKRARKAAKHQRGQATTRRRGEGATHER